MTDVQKIKAHLKSGYAFVNYLQSVMVDGKPSHVGSSADRTCRRICNGDKNYSYFMVEPSYGNISEYKCFVSKPIKGMMIIKDSDGLYRISKYTGKNTVHSKAYKTKR